MLEVSRDANFLTIVVLNLDAEFIREALAAGSIQWAKFGHPKKSLTSIKIQISDISSLCLGLDSVVHRLHSCPHLPAAKFVAEVAQKLRDAYC